MIIVLVRRCVKPANVEEFLKVYEKESPNNQKPRPEGFIRERIAKVDDSNTLPEALRNLPIRGSVSKDFEIYVNVAEWNTWQDFENYRNSLPPSSKSSADEISIRQRAILDFSGTR